MNAASPSNSSGSSPGTSHQASVAKDGVVAKKTAQLGHRCFFLLALAMTVGSTLIWILSIEGILQGSWSNIMGAFSSMLGVLFAVLQYYTQMTSQNENGGEISLQTLPVIGEHLRYLPKQKGMLVVQVSKELRQKAIYLSHGFDLVSYTPDLVANAMLRQINQKKVFVALFPIVNPGNYTIYIASREHIVPVTIYAGYCTEIDWR